PLSVVSAAASPSTPPLSLHDALPICADSELRSAGRALRGALLAGPGAERDGAAKQLQGHFRELQALGSDVGKFFRNADNQARIRSEEHTSELQSRENLVCRLLLEKKK